jgi:hypothetical protein
METRPKTAIEQRLEGMDPWAGDVINNVFDEMGAGVVTSSPKVITAVLISYVQSVLNNVGMNYPVDLADPDDDRDSGAFPPESDIRQALEALEVITMLTLGVNGVGLLQFVERLTGDDALERATLDPDGGVIWDGDNPAN